MNPITIAVVSMFVRLILGSDIFTRVELTVQRWSSRKIAGAEKRDGVLAELEVIGLKAAEWALRLAIELAVGKMKKFDTGAK